jgi:hypothetical protein
MSEDDVDEMERGYVDIERRTHLDVEGADTEAIGQPNQGTTKLNQNPGPVIDEKMTLKERDRRQGRVVDVVLSDMSEPWDQVTGFHKKSLSDPYLRLMNTSGIAFKDHAGSMVSKLNMNINIFPSHPIESAPPISMEHQTEVTLHIGPLHGRAHLLLRHSPHRRPFLV